MDGLQQRERVLENQVQGAVKIQQNLANQLARTGIRQVENSVKQLQFAQLVQSVAANVFESKGLNDVNKQNLI